MLKCREVTELVTDHLEHQLDWWMRLQFLRHVIACRHCRRYVNQIKKLVKLLARLPNEPPPQGMEDLLSERFRVGMGSQAG